MGIHLKTRRQVDSAAEQQFSLIRVLSNNLPQFFNESISRAGELTKWESSYSPPGNRIPNSLPCATNFTRPQHTKGQICALEPAPRYMLSSTKSTLRPDRLTEVQVAAWKLRGNLPHAVEATALLSDAILHDDAAKNSVFSIRATYAAAFCR